MTPDCDLCGLEEEECVCYQTKDPYKLGQMLDQATVLFGEKAGGQMIGPIDKEDIDSEEDSPEATEWTGDQG